MEYGAAASAVPINDAGEQIAPGSVPVVEEAAATGGGDEGPDPDIPGGVSRDGI